MIGEIRVVNKYKEPDHQYIGRGSVLGNKFKVGTQQGWDRDHVIGLYRDWLRHQVNLVKNPVVLTELRRLYRLALVQDVNLGCFCSPQACHGDVIKEFLDEQLMLAREEELSE